MARVRRRGSIAESLALAATAVAALAGCSLDALPAIDLAAPMVDEGVPPPDVSTQQADRNVTPIDAAADLAVSPIDAAVPIEDLAIPAGCPQLPRCNGQRRCMFGDPDCLDQLDQVCHCTHGERYCVPCSCPDGGYIGTPCGVPNVICVYDFE